MTQPDLFATNAVGEAVVRDVWSPSTPAQEAREEQARQLARVSGALAERIRLFLVSCLATGGTFYASELHEAVGGAPASADRVLRALKAAGEVTYSVARGQSLYTIETLTRAQP